ncbi:hypothetical protein HMPREF9466_03044 [Fusobacterium necrophorum subsp. funduliforme 1_1_36S]|nr:hypothetical protein HMPREF9466_03044 [Fusobacterium necrophorum subsp. funduliforme 1_1_36S]
MYIKVSMNIKEIIAKYPETKAVFENQGIQGLEEEKVLQILEAYPLSEIMKLKKMDASAFVNRLEESIKATRETSDITMKKKKKENAISLLGLLPCPVRIPLLEGFQNFLQAHPDIEVNYELKAASSGLAWLKKMSLKQITSTNWQTCFYPPDLIYFSITSGWENGKQRVSLRI